MSDAALFKKVAIIGLGLIGSSILSAMRDKGLTKYVIATDTDSDSLKFAKDVGLIDERATDIESLCRTDIDLFIIATSTRATAAIIDKLAHIKAQGNISNTVIITDVASTKDSIYQAVKLTLIGPFGVSPASSITEKPYGNISFDRSAYHRPP